MMNTRRRVKLVISHSVVWWLLFGAALVSPASSRQIKEDEQRAPKQITAESYWYNVGLDRVLNSHETETDIVGVIQARHGISPFRVRKDEARNPDAKTRGLVMVVEELVAWLGTTSKNFAQSRLQAMAGEQFTDTSDWGKWFRTNSPYLVWSDRRNRLVVDDEAKKAGVSTGQFRKDHPWPERP